VTMLCCRNISYRKMCTLDAWRCCHAAAAAPLLLLPLLRCCCGLDLACIRGCCPLPPSAQQLVSSHARPQHVLLTTACTISGLHMVHQYHTLLH
jgi:hypothetical protein